MRKMARVVKIDDVINHNNADTLEIAKVGGWQVIIRKGEFKTNEYAIFCEIDSWVPTELAPFLSKGKEPREYNGVKGEKLRTIRLRGELSQGLLLPVAECFGDTVTVSSNNATPFKEGDDVSEVLNIQKWEPPVSAQLRGQTKGNFPSIFFKTDQERIQNLSRKLDEWIAQGLEFEVTEKLEGSSMTCYLLEDGTFGVCSRNLDLKRDENNTFWATAIKLDIEAKMKAYFGETPEKAVCLQGELIGEGIQKNIYGLKGYDFRVFDIQEAGGKYFDSDDRAGSLAEMKIDSVPVLGFGTVMPMEDMLEYAQNNSRLANTKREGVVWKCLTDPSISFKVVNNEYLLSEK
mgnify:CR=1 FL=1|jgi:RNA ligase (TIGR02306 family)